MDMGILISSMLRAHGFTVSAEVLTVRTDRLIEIDFHPANVLFYAELDVESGFAYNENVYINPKSRHKGIGTRLLAAHEEICREAGLTILINNNRNPGFWKRQGYRHLNPFWEILLTRQLGIAFMKESMYKKV